MSQHHRLLTENKESKMKENSSLKIMVPHRKQPTRLFYGTPDFDFSVCLGVDDGNVDVLATERRKIK